MITVTVKCGSGMSPQKEWALVRLLTDSVAGILDVPPDEVTVILEKIDPKSWAAGRELYADKFSWSFRWPGA